jgi:predicted transcriptional regulator
MKNEKIKLGVIIDKETKDALDECAERTGLSRGFIVNYAIKEFLKNPEFTIQ